jgi:hypothetical protein
MLEFPLPVSLWCTEFYAKNLVCYEAVERAKYKDAVNLKVEMSHAFGYGL